MNREELMSIIKEELNEYLSSRSPYEINKDLGEISMDLHRINFETDMTRSDKKQLKKTLQQIINVVKRNGITL